MNEATRTRFEIAARDLLGQLADAFDRDPSLQEARLEESTPMWHPDAGTYYLLAKYEGLRVAILVSPAGDGFFDNNDAARGDLNTAES